MTFHAVNWNKQDDDYSLMFWNQNWQQVWTDTEIPVSDDILTWSLLSKTEKEVYKRVLAGLTLLDTEQGGIGMPLIMQHMTGLQKKAVFSFMGAMEQMHAKSYSTIFTTLATTEEIDQLFDEWIVNNKYLQAKAKIISEHYQGIKNNKDVYMACVASVFLESFLFYSGFFYPLYLAGQGKLTNSGEIINLILRDEAIHGSYVGMVAQEAFESLNKREKNRVKADVYDLLEELYVNELAYTDELYTPIGLQEEVKKYIRYNANRALMNLGLDAHFPEEDVNPIVLNGLKTTTINHDFFSQKGNGYIFQVNVEQLRDEDFIFDEVQK